MDHAGVSMFEVSRLIEFEKKEDKRSQQPILTDDQYRKRVREKKLAICVLERANMQVYRHLIHSLRDQYLMGVNAYLDTMEKGASIVAEPQYRKKIHLATAVYINWVHSHWSTMYPTRECW